MHSSAFLLFLATAALLSAVSAPDLSAQQITPGSISLGIEAGPALYLGEFNSLEPDNSFHIRIGYDADVNARYHLNEQWSLGATVGFSRLLYSVDALVRTKYASNFFGPVGDPTFPSSTVAFTDDYHISLTRYGLFGQFRPLPDGLTVPFFSVGLEGFSFQTYNDSGETLPENLTGTVEHRSLALSLGVGAEYPISSWLSGTLQGTFYIPFTDYLDGYAHYLSFETSPGIPGPGTAPTLDDHALSLRVGLTALVFKPSKRRPEEEPPTAQRNDPGQSNPANPQESPAQQPPPAQTPQQPPSQSPQQPPSQQQPQRQTPQPTATDRDGDGLSDVEETGRYMTDPGKKDTDGDMVGDRDELFRFNTSPNNPDTDGDELLDGQEVYVYKTNPLVRDTDHDGLTDGEEVLRDGSNPLKADSDGDGVLDNIEVERGSNPLNRDTDNDGVNDKDDACPTSFGPASNKGCPEELGAANRP